MRTRFDPPPAGEHYDFTLTEHGSMWKLTPITDSGKNWYGVLGYPQGRLYEAREVPGLIDTFTKNGLRVDWK